MVFNMRWKRGAALLAAGVLAAGTLSGCVSQNTVETVAESMASLRNDGHAVRLVVGQLTADADRTRVLEEIAGKYTADFPETDIEIRTYASKQELEAALDAGEADLAEVSGGDQAAYVKQGRLLDIYPYVKAWDESATFTPAAEQAVGSMGMEHAYLIPFDFDQDLLYYRADWFDAYNEGLEKDLARCRTWQEIGGGEINGVPATGAAEKLGDKGKLAFAGKEKLVDYFDAMVWSAISVGRIADPAAAYFSAEDERKSIFSLEKTPNGVAQFAQVMKTAALEDAWNWTEKEALAAFLDGRAGMLLAGRDVMPALREAMGDGTWAVLGYPRGIIGSAVFADEFTGWGISAATKEEEIAAHFLTYLSNADNNTHFAKMCGTLPIHLEAADMEVSLLETDLAVELDMVKRGNWYQYASEPVMYRAYEGYREQANERLRGFLRGEVSQDELLSWLDGYWNQAYAEEGNLWK